MPSREWRSNRKTTSDKREKRTKTDVEKGADPKGRNRAGLVTASLRHRGFCFQLMLAGSAREKTDKEVH